MQQRQPKQIARLPLSFVFRSPMSVHHHAVKFLTHGSHILVYGFVLHFCVHEGLGLTHSKISINFALSNIKTDDNESNSLRTC